MNKLVDQYNNTYHCFIDKKPVGSHYSDLSEEIESSQKAPKFKVGNKVKITKYKNIIGYRKNCSREIFDIDSVLIKNLNREKIRGNFYEKQLLFFELLYKSR